MISLASIPIPVFSVICSSLLFTANSLLLFVLLILVTALVVLYLRIVKYKNKLVFVEGDAKNRIRELKKMLGSKDLEINNLRSKLKMNETKWNDWDEEKDKLIRKIKNQEKQIENYKMNENVTKDDLIIEYYLNKKSVDKV